MLIVVLNASALNRSLLNYFLNFFLLIFKNVGYSPYGFQLKLVACLKNEFISEGYMNLDILRWSS